MYGFIHAATKSCHSLFHYPVRIVHRQFIIDWMVAAGNWNCLFVNGPGLGPLASFFLVLLNFCDDNGNHDHNQDKHDKDHIWKPHANLLWLFGSVADHNLIGECHSDKINPSDKLSTIIVWISLKVNAIFAASWRWTGSRFGWNMLHLHSMPLKRGIDWKYKRAPSFPFPRGNDQSSV